MAKRKRLGELLVEACIITQEQLEDALHIQKSHPRLIGQILVEMGWVSEKEVCRAVSELLNVDFVFRIGCEIAVPSVTTVKNIACFISELEVFSL